MNGPRATLQRGRDHIDEFKLRSEAELATEGYLSCEIEKDLVKGVDRYKIKQKKEFPDFLDNIAADAIQNIRASLDQAFFVIAKFAGGDLDKSKFPFGDEAKPDSLLADPWKKSIPKEIWAEIVKFRPYKGGDEYLPLLNRLNNDNKHRMISPVALNTGSSTTAVTGSGSFDLAWPVWNREKKEILLATVKHGSTFAPKFQVLVIFELSLGGEPIFPGRCAVDVMVEFSKKAESIINAMELKAVEIGLIASN